MMFTSFHLSCLFLLCAARQGTTTAFIITGVPPLSARPCQERIGLRWEMPQIERQALVYGPDGTLVESDMEPQSSLLLQEEEAYPQTQEILSFLRQTNFHGPLAVLAAAHGHIGIETIQEVTVLSVDLHSLQLAAMASAADDMCVKIMVDIPFPVACSPENFQQDVVDNLGALHASAKTVVDEQLAAKEKTEEVLVADLLRQELIQANEVFIPIWWIPAGELASEANLLRGLINDNKQGDSENDCLRELVVGFQKGSSEDQQPLLLSSVEDAAVVAIGKQGIVIRATDGQRFAEVPIQFPVTATSPQDLRNAVLDIIEGSTQAAAVAAAADFMEEVQPQTVAAEMESTPAENVAEPTSADMGPAVEEEFVVALQATPVLSIDQKNVETHRKLMEYRFYLEDQQRSTKKESADVNMDQKREEARRKLMEYRFYLEAQERSMKNETPEVDMDQKYVKTHMKLMEYRFYHEARQRSMQNETPKVTMDQKYVETRRKLMEYRFYLEGQKRTIKNERLQLVVAQELDAMQLNGDGNQEKVVAEEQTDRHEGNLWSIVFS